MAQVGWIKLHRKIQECELWLDDEPFSKRDAWIDLLLMANHEPKKVLLGNQLVEVLPGQRVTSQAQLAARWRWGRQKVRSYLKLLETLGQITTSITNKWTVITIVKYGVYQISATDEKPAENQQKTNEEPSGNHQIATNKNDKEYIKNDKEYNIPSSYTEKYISSNADDGSFNLFKAVENAIKIPMTHDLAQLFVALYEEVGEGVLKEALAETVKHGGRSYSYVETVARRIASGGNTKSTNAGAIDWDDARKRILGDEGNGN